MRATITLLLLLVVARSGNPDPAPISLSTRFAHGFEPATVTFVVTIPTHPDTTAAFLDFDSIGGNAGRSVLDAHRPIQQSTLTRLPAGEYQAVAVVVRRGNRQHQSARVSFTVLSMRGE